MPDPSLTAAAVTGAMDVAASGIGAIMNPLLSTHSGYQNNVGSAAAAQHNSYQMQTLGSDMAYNQAMQRNDLIGLVNTSKELGINPLAMLGQAGNYSPASSSPISPQSPDIDLTSMFNTAAQVLTSMPNQFQRNIMNAQYELLKQKKEIAAAEEDRRSKMFPVDFASAQLRKDNLEQDYFERLQTWDDRASYLSSKAQNESDKHDINELVKTAKELENQKMEVYKEYWSEVAKYEAEGVKQSALMKKESILEIQKRIQKIDSDIEYNNKKMLLLDKQISAADSDPMTNISKLIDSAIDPVKNKNWNLAVKSLAALLLSFSVGKNNKGFSFSFN